MVIQVYVSSIFIFFILKKKHLHLFQWYISFKSFSFLFYFTNVLFLVQSLSCSSRDTKTTSDLLRVWAHWLYKGKMISPLILRLRKLSVWYMLLGFAFFMLLIHTLRATRSERMKTNWVVEDSSVSTDAHYFHAWWCIMWTIIWGCKW